MNQEIEREERLKKNEKVIEKYNRKNFLQLLGIFFDHYSEKDFNRSKRSLLILLFTPGLSYVFVNKFLYQIPFKNGIYFGIILSALVNFSYQMNLDFRAKAKEDSSLGNKIKEIFNNLAMNELEVPVFEKNQSTKNNQSFKVQVIMGEYLTFLYVFLLAITIQVQISIFLLVSNFLFQYTVFLVLELILNFLICLQNMLIILSEYNFIQAANLSQIMNFYYQQYFLDQNKLFLQAPKCYYLQIFFIQYYNIFIPQQYLEMQIINI